MKFRVSKRTAWTVVIVAASIEVIIILALIIQAHSRENNVLTETRLSTHISSAYDANSLIKDIHLADAALSQERKDVSIESNGLKQWKIEDSSGKVLTGTNATERLIQEQLSASIFLSSTTKNEFNQLTASLSQNVSKLNDNLNRVALIKSADDQQAAEQIMASLQDRLTVAISLSGKKGLTITDLEADLTTYSSDRNAANNLSSSMEADLIKKTYSTANMPTYLLNINAAQSDCSASLNAANAIIGILRD